MTHYETKLTDYRLTLGSILLANHQVLPFIAKTSQPLPHFQKSKACCFMQAKNLWKGWTIWKPDISGIFNSVLIEFFWA